MILWRIALVCLVLGLLGAGGWWTTHQRPAEVRLSAFSTSLRGRSASQRHNALEALSHLDGVRLAPGDTFSYNDTVGTWSRDAGYRKAPVSYNGQLIWSFGGGVCQTSTTLYNAALLAGVPVIERHSHHFAPGYVVPGRDAAVAFPAIDLKFTNPYPWPLRIAARESHDSLVIELWGREQPDTACEITTQLREVREPKVLGTGSRQASGKLVNPGKAGYSVVTWRVLRDPSGERRELLSVDDYPAMHQVIAHSG